MLEFRTTALYRKDYKRIIRRGLDVSLLENVISLLLEEKPLPLNYHDHALGGEHKGKRECHIMPDWLLVYKKDGRKLTLTALRTGTHSDLDL